MPDLGYGYCEDNRVAFPLTPRSLAYSWRHLTQLAGVTGGDPLGVGLEGVGEGIRYANPAEASADSADIIVAPCSDAARRFRSATTVSAPLW